LSMRLWASRHSRLSPLDGQRVRRGAPRSKGLRRRLTEATQTGRDQAEIDRPALGEQRDLATERHSGRVGHRLAHGWRAYHQGHRVDRPSHLPDQPQSPGQRLDSGTFTAVAVTVSPCGVASTPRTWRLYGSRGIWMLTDRSCLIEPIMLLMTCGMSPPS